MVDEKKDRPGKLDLDAEARTALEQACKMQPGPARTEAMKRAGILRNAADLQGLFFRQARKTGKRLRLPRAAPVATPAYLGALARVSEGSSPKASR